MEADVDEVGGEVEEERPLDGVGDDEADVVAAKQADEFGCGEGFVADFDAVADAGAGGGVAQRGDGASREALMMHSGEGGHFAVGAGEEIEEGGEAVGVEAHLRRELPEDGAKFAAEREDTAGEEVGERLLDVAELEHVGDEAWAFDGEEEAGGSFSGPAAEACGALHGVEGAVDFDRGEEGGGVLELAALREFWRIEDAAPVFVAPAGDADADSAVRMGGHALWCIQMLLCAGAVRARKAICVGCCWGTEYTSCKFHYEKFRP